MLKKLSDDLRLMADEACLTVLVDEHVVVIQKRLKLKDSSTLGVFLLGLMGAGLMLIPWIASSNMTSRVIGLMIGLFMLLGAVLTLIREVTDKVIIKDKQVLFCYNLKRTTIPIEPNMRVYTQTKRRHISRADTISKEFIELTLVLMHHNKELPVLRFQMDVSNADNASRLGNELAHIINARLCQ